MELESLQEHLRFMNFYVMNDENIGEEFYDANLEFWTDGNKAVVIKEYRTVTSFYEWLTNDQPFIAALYDSLLSHLRKNLYFLLVVNFSLQKDNDINLEINKAEKNDFVCKKYILKSMNDLNKIPFLNNRVIEKSNFNYELEFKKTITDINTVSNIANEKNFSTESFYSLAHKLLDYYFEDYLEDQNDNDLVRKKIEQLGERR